MEQALYQVVIPTQTIGFYNEGETVTGNLPFVVIPTQTIGFYNFVVAFMLVGLTVLSYLPKR